MLGNANANAVLAVKDMVVARQFYEGTLGLTVEHDSEHEVVYKSGESVLSIYPSSYAGTNQATAASWEVPNVEEAVAELQGKGVTFEEYDMEGVERNGAVHTMGNNKSAWFKDPDGNILCLHQKV